MFHQRLGIPCPAEQQPASQGFLLYVVICMKCVACYRGSWWWYSSAALARGCHTNRFPLWKIWRSPRATPSHTTRATAMPGAVPLLSRGHQVWMASSPATATRTAMAHGTAKKVALFLLGLTAPAMAAVNPGGSLKALRKPSAKVHMFHCVFSALSLEDIVHHRMGY